MPSTFQIIAAVAVLIAQTLAAPTQAEREAVTKIAVRQRPTTTAISNSDQLAQAISDFSADFASASAAARLQSELQEIASANPNDFFASGFNILANGLAGGDYVQIANAYLLESSTDNINPINPATPVYPQAGPSDAPYSLSEADLRKVIYIPPGFTYGRIPPVIFLPGTAALGGQNFGPNYGKLFTENKIADPVYVNLPGENLADIQVAAEYAAYAVNYISGISGGKNVSTISWSAGSLDGQWAFKYWPSTRSKVSDKIGISPDYHGTIEAQLLCPGYATLGCTPAIAQQNYNSTFIRTLRNTGGDSAFVPTTNVYSIFDQIVEPQQNPDASGSLGDARDEGVSNTELQTACTAVLPGGESYNTHEGVLYNALAYALAVDALQHPGPGELSRINVTYQCSQFATPGLSLADILATEALIPLAVANTLAFEPKVASEPPIMPYAQKDIPA
ncbi:alpha/beta-hydrolase [Teratosphaeria nubilosa]|uniref:Alpha/beta-hydrolase n=1 Tax=Teratosphaeria nubilosa TaxID=161662 RepID=A0A6G1KTW9_9PEZI|nr:alpha/beta-hydrolase [Teratosphaeria nubilosa]